MELNDLSWLIYFAEVSQRASRVFGLIAFLWLCISIPIGGIPLAMWVDREIKGWIPAILIPSLILIEMLFIIGAITLPSKDTILMIAASEMGETVVNTPEARELFESLRELLMQKIEGLKK